MRTSPTGRLLRSMTRTWSLISLLSMRTTSSSLTSCSVGGLRARRLLDLDGRLHLELRRAARRGRRLRRGGGRRRRGLRGGGRLLRGLLLRRRGRLLLRRGGGLRRGPDDAARAPAVVQLRPRRGDGADQQRGGEQRRDERARRPPRRGRLELLDFSSAQPREQRLETWGWRPAKMSLTESPASSLQPLKIAPRVRPPCTGWGGRGALTVSGPTLSAAAAPRGRGACYYTRNALKNARLKRLRAPCLEMPRGTAPLPETVAGGRWSVVSEEQKE